jgi:hypothetical protein
MLTKKVPAGFFFAVFPFWLAACINVTAAQQPNILLIMADDKY